MTRIPFHKLSRPEQRRNLLRRLGATRREIEQYLRDLAAFNDIQRSRGAQKLPDDPEMVALLANIDQRIQQMKDAR